MICYFFLLKPISFSVITNAGCVPLQTEHGTFLNQTLFKWAFTEYNTDVKLNNRREKKSRWIMLNIPVTLRKRKNSFSVMYPPNQELKEIKKLNETDKTLKALYIICPNRIILLWVACHTELFWQQLNPSSGILYVLIIHEHITEVFLWLSPLRSTQLLRTIKIDLVVFDHD